MVDTPSETSLEQWLKALRFGQDVVTAILEQAETLEDLLGASDEDLAELSRSWKVLVRRRFLSELTRLRGRASARAGRLARLVRAMARKRLQSRWYRWLAATLVQRQGLKAREVIVEICRQRDEQASRHEEAVEQLTAERKAHHEALAHLVSKHRVDLDRAAADARNALRAAVQRRDAMHAKTLAGRGGGDVDRASRDKETALAALAERSRVEKEALSVEKDAALTALGKRTRKERDVAVAKAPKVAVDRERKRLHCDQEAALAANDTRSGGERTTVVDEAVEAERAILLAEKEAALAALDARLKAALAEAVQVERQRLLSDKEASLAALDARLQAKRRVAVTDATRALSTLLVARYGAEIESMKQGRASGSPRDGLKRGASKRPRLTKVSPVAEDDIKPPTAQCDSATKPEKDTYRRRHPLMIAPMPKKETDRRRHPIRIAPMPKKETDRRYPHIMAT